VSIAKKINYATSLLKCRL